MQLTHEETILICPLLYRSTGGLNYELYKKFLGYINQVGLQERDAEEIVKPQGGRYGRIVIDGNKIREFIQKKRLSV